MRVGEEDNARSAVSVLKFYWECINLGWLKLGLDLSVSVFIFLRNSPYIQLK